ncbi:MAG: hypothetical protein ACT4PV_06745 [Planctomycetaceae bacterium]
MHSPDFHALFRAADRSLPMPGSRRRGVVRDEPACGPRLARGRGLSRRRFRPGRLVVPILAVLLAAAIVLFVYRVWVAPLLT